MISIRGKILQGSGQGQNTLKEQMPFFRDCFPEVGNCRPATINILLDKPLIVLNPDFTTQSVPWHPAFKVVKGGEVFQFVRIRLAVEGLAPVNAWIYRAQFSPYRENPFLIEVLAPALDFHGATQATVEVLSTAHEGVIVGASDALPEPTQTKPPATAAGRPPSAAPGASRA